MYLCLLRVLDRADFSDYFYMAYPILIGTFVMHLHMTDRNNGNVIIGGAYCLIGLVFFAICKMTNTLAAHYLHVVWMIFYFWACPECTPFQVKIETLTEIYDG